MSSSKKIDLYNDFTSGVYLTIYSCPLTRCSVQYTVYFLTQGRGELERRLKPERREEGPHFTKLGRKYQHD
jgi:hypothetical protein